MPETTTGSRAPLTGDKREDMTAYATLQEVRDELDQARGAAGKLTADRDYLIRRLRSQLSLKKLSEASGLSIAQVQRICDLSKLSDVERVNRGQISTPTGWVDAHGPVDDLSKDRSE